MVVLGCVKTHQRLYKEGYSKGVDDFINFIFLNLKNISGDEIRCPCVMCKNKKVSLIRCCDDASSKNRVCREIIMLVCTQ
jgi:hypothetical protein